MAETERLFEAELRLRGVRCARRPDGRFDVLAPDGNRVVSLAPLGPRAGLPEMVRFIEKLLAAPAVPAWAEARARVYWCVDCGSLSFGDTLFEKVSDRTARVLVLCSDSADARLSWVTEKHLRDWGATADALQQAASANLDRLLVGQRLELDRLGGVRVARVPPSSPLASSVIFAPGFRAFIEPELGWPVLAAVPNRDCLYLVAEADRVQVPRLGPHIRDAFRTGEYPVSTEVLHLSDAGIRAISAFPE